MSCVFITDYIKNPNIEKKILGSNLSENPNKNIKILLVWHEKIDANYLNKFPNLVGIVRYGVGYDNIDLKEVKKRGLIFCNTPDYGIDEVSDTTLSMILDIIRGVSKYNIYSKSYKNSWQENTIKNLRRSSSINLGIVGAGRIGSAVMLKAKALKIPVMFFDPYKERGYEKTIGVLRTDDLDNLLTKSDIISLHVSLNSETKGMVNEGFIKKMKNGSSLINTSRGEVIKDIDLLYNALLTMKLYHVALDVLSNDKTPPVSCKFIDAWKSKESNVSSRITINPHTAYYSKESFLEMRTKTSENALRILNGLVPYNIIVNTS